MPRRDQDYSLSIFSLRDRCDDCREHGLPLIRGKDGTRLCVSCWKDAQAARKARLDALKASLAGWRAGRTLRTGAALALALLLPASAGAQQPPRCANGTCYTYPVYRAPAPQPPPQHGGFLAELNRYRARYGRGPVVYDPALAAAASTNNVAGHARHSIAGRSGQCWAGTRDELHALRMWFASPPHARILLSATRAVGWAACPTGYTLNAD